MISILDSTGDFVVSESGAIAVSGRVYAPEDVSKEIIDIESFATEDIEQDFHLEHGDIYKDLRLRGYDYAGKFRGLKTISSRGLDGKLAWEGDYISFMDTMLQMTIFGQDSRELFVPTRLLKAVIDPKKHAEAVAGLDPEKGKI